MNTAAPAFELRTYGSIRELGQTVYDRLLPPGRPPFLSFAWLDALERTGCVGEERGWLPQHISLYENDECVAAAPAAAAGRRRSAPAHGSNRGCGARRRARRFS